MQDLEIFVPPNYKAKDDDKLAKVNSFAKRICSKTPVIIKNLLIIKVVKIFRVRYI